jgi:uncharacterized protein YyaL (SSP411 family)
VIGDERWLSAARRTVSFIREKLVREDGRLMRSFHLGEAATPGFLDDYAFYAWGLIELYEATLDSGCLDEARRLCDEMLRLFGSPGRAGLFETGADAEQLPVRGRAAYDGALPSGNSVAAMDLLRLGRITGDPALSQAGEETLRAFMGGAARQPAGYLQLLAAYDYFLGPEVEITLVGPPEAEETRRLLRAAKKRFIPNLVLRHAAEGGAMQMLAGRSTAYVCAKGSCRPPVNDPAELTTLLDAVL